MINQQTNKKSSAFNYTFSAIIYGVGSIMISRGFVQAVYPLLSLLLIGALATILVSVVNLSANGKIANKEKTDFLILLLRFMTNILMGVTIYQVYLLGFVFISGALATILAINLSDTLIKMLE